MPKRLNADALERRLRLDESTMALVNVNLAPIRVTAHRSAADARSGVRPIASGSGAAPEHYRVIYEFETLRGPGLRHRPTIVHFDLMANGSYPFSEPICRTVGEVTPWTPHFHEVYPICIGAGWPKQTAPDAGEALAVDLVRHIAKLLNFDEPLPAAGYSGYNGPAIDWWRKQNRCRPLNPGLLYPNIDPNEPDGGSAAVVRRTATPVRSPIGTRFAGAGPARAVPGPAERRFAHAASRFEAAGRSS